AQAAGARREHVFGFFRRQGRLSMAVAVPRLLTRFLAVDAGPPLGRNVWEDTVLLLPDADKNRRWRNVFTGEIVKGALQSGQTGLSLAEMLAHFPVALLLAET